MEKYGQYRDKGSGIAPFFPTTPQASTTLLLPWSIFLFFVRVPLLVFAWAVWLVFIQWAPAGTLLRKANIWCAIGIPGIWWVDLQVDGVRRGALGRAGSSHMPTSGSIIASSCTSPIDIIYLAAIFDPVFTQSYPGTRMVRPITLSTALLSCFSIISPPVSDSEEGLTTLAKLSAKHPNRIIAVFPEATTSNGRGILRFTHSLLSASPSTKIFPVSIRYTPPDIVTPVPGWYEALRFLWRLNSKPTHVIRTRIGTPVVNGMSVESLATAQLSPEAIKRSNYESNFFDTLNSSDSQVDEEEPLSDKERKILDAVGDTLARLGRVKRVSLGVEEKAGFVLVWKKGSRSRR